MVKIHARNGCPSEYCQREDHTFKNVSCIWSADCGSRTPHALRLAKPVPLRDNMYSSKRMLRRSAYIFVFIIANLCHGGRRVSFSIVLLIHFLALYCCLYLWVDLASPYQCMLFSFFVIVPKWFANHVSPWHIYIFTPEVWMYIFCQYWSKSLIKAGDLTNISVCCWKVFLYKAMIASNNITLCGALCPFRELLFRFLKHDLYVSNTSDEALIQMNFLVSSSNSRKPNLTSRNWIANSERDSCFAICSQLTQNLYFVRD